VCSVVAKKKEVGHLGGSVSKAPDFGSGHDLGVLKLTPLLGSLLGGECACPSPSAPPPVPALSLSLK